MDAIQPTAKKLHPLVATAAVAVTVVSVLGAIVLITDQVAAHRGDSGSAVTAADAGNGTSATPAPTGTETSTAPTRPSSSHRVAPPKAPASDTYAQAAAVPPPPPGAAAPPPVCNDCGMVAAVRTLKTAGQ